MKSSEEKTYHSFEVFPNDRIAVLGRQSSGKTAFVKSIESSNAIVVDDALIGKDPVSGAAFLNELSNEKRPVIAVLPSIAWAKRFANRVVGIQNGKIVLDSPTEELNSDSFRKIYVGEGPAILKIGSATLGVNKSTAKISTFKTKSPSVRLVLPFFIGFTFGAALLFLIQKFALGLF